MRLSSPQYVFTSSVVNSSGENGMQVSEFKYSQIACLVAGISLHVSMDSVRTPRCFRIRIIFKSPYKHTPLIKGVWSC